MKILITESQYRKIIIEEYTNIDDYHELIYRTEYDVLFDIKLGRKIGFTLINPIQYKKALQEFMDYGKILKFPERLIYEWKDICIENIVLLEVLTQINGHTSYFPFDVVFDVFDDDPEIKAQKYDWGYVIEYLDEKYNIDELLPQFSNGEYVMSDYGLEPLQKLVKKLIPMTDVNQILVTINMIMDVAHQRSDLSEIFLEGGQESHFSISNT